MGKSGRKNGLDDASMLGINPWSRLRLAIIFRAVYDWRLCTTPAIRNSYPGNLIEIRRFFQSKWCQTLMVGIENIEPEEILWKLEKESRSAAEKNEVSGAHRKTL